VTHEVTLTMENAAASLKEFDIQREMNHLPKAVIPMMVPLVILMIELAVANAYLGILVSRLTVISEEYTTYLFGNAAAVLLGLTSSLLWLVSYRGLLSYRTRSWSWSKRRQAARLAREGSRAVPEHALRSKFRAPAGDASSSRSPQAMPTVGEDDEEDMEDEVDKVLSAGASISSNDLPPGQGPKVDALDDQQPSAASELISARTNSDRGAACATETSRDTAASPDAAARGGASPKPVRSRKGVSVGWNPFNPLEAEATWGGPRRPTGEPSSEDRRHRQRL